ncbi:hypothetical protein ACO22_03585 [Paracoccidioides brasiliensis]|uniref:Uncharacterized protein n=1 Tax=Paracoccidioides brasiliensis TaxID=121759 RepID=A0A1D2JFR2_PARBR|nr:hypothetical protein ACO22_03585 [Paracoccidioides brasiliensis]
MAPKCSITEKVGRRLVTRSSNDSAKRPIEHGMQHTMSHSASFKIAQGTRSGATDQPIESCPYETCFRAQGQEIRLGVVALGQLVNGFTDRSRSRYNERHTQLKEPNLEEGSWLKPPDQSSGRVLRCCLLEEG